MEEERLFNFIKNKKMEISTQLQQLDKNQLKKKSIDLQDKFNQNKKKRSDDFSSLMQQEATNENDRVINNFFMYNKRHSIKNDITNTYLNQKQIEEKNSQILSSNNLILVPSQEDDKIKVK